MLRSRVITAKPPIRAKPPDLIWEVSVTKAVTSRTATPLSSDKRMSPDTDDLFWKPLVQCLPPTALVLSQIQSDDDVVDHRKLEVFSSGLVEAIGGRADGHPGRGMDRLFESRRVGPDQSAKSELVTDVELGRPVIGHHQ